MTAVLEKKGPIASITIRGKNPLNILDKETIAALKDHFLACEKDPDIKVIFLTGQGHKAFSAGGDVKEVYFASEERGQYEFENFDREFELNKIIMEGKKILVSHMKGIAMGGGVAITLGGDFSCTDQSTHFALPEIDLGMIPDVGLGYYISQLDQTPALFITLLGRSLGGSDAVKFGFASHYIDQKSWPKIVDEIHHLNLATMPLSQVREEVAKILSHYSLPIESNSLEEEMKKAKVYFSQGSLLEILQSLKKDPSPMAQALLLELREKCPIASHIAFVKYLAGKNWDRQETFQHDRRILKYCYEKGNMKEGIRATLLDKDAPNFPSSLEEIRVKEIEDLVYGKEPI